MRISDQWPVHAAVSGNPQALVTFITFGQTAQRAYWPDAMLRQPYRSVLSRPGRLEKVADVGIRRLSRHASVSETQDLRIGCAIATRSGFNSQQYRGRSS